jgi:hypothetical protein
LLVGKDTGPVNSTFPPKGVGLVLKFTNCMIEAQHMYRISQYALERMQYMVTNTLENKLLPELYLNWKTGY